MRYMKTIVVLGLGAAALFAADFVAEGDRWWAHIQFLADDKLQGRDTGSDGYREAVKYVSGKMETFGLKPAGTSGYLQPVKFETRQLADEESSIAIVRDGVEEVLERLDATQNSRADLAPAAEAAMVFVGYGLRVPEAKYDDLAGVDLRGKVAVYVNSTGALDAPGPVKSHVGTASERWAVLKAAGAIGTATIMNPRTPAGAAGGADRVADGARLVRGHRVPMPRTPLVVAGVRAADAVLRRPSCWPIRSYRSLPGRRWRSRLRDGAAINFSRGAGTRRMRF